MSSRIPQTNPGILSFLLFIALCPLSFSQNDSPNLSPPAPDFEVDATTLLSAGNQRRAETNLGNYVAQHGDNQRALFLSAVRTRSRFEISEAEPLFKRVVAMDPTSPSGQCAEHLIKLDSNQNVKQEFLELEALVKKSPDDLFLLWMLAVECRTYNRNEEGVACYAKILATWNPGPVLVHQTYANLLSGLKRYDEALVERRQAVAMEPCEWTYGGLAGTLTDLKKYDEANQVYQKMIDESPNDSSNWNSWAWSLIQQNKPDEAISKAKKAVELDAKNDDAWCEWGDALALEGNRSEALIKFKMAFEINPKMDYYKRRLKELDSKQN